VAALRIALVLDDEDAIRYFIGVVLRRSGFTVFEAVNLAEARRVWELTRGAIDVVLADVYLGSENGIDFAAFAQEQKATIRIILMSGYIGDGFDRPLLGSHTILFKPFTAVELLCAVNAGKTER
jgi:DNA-binding response OmpR family regulator